VISSDERFKLGHYRKFGPFDRFLNPCDSPRDLHCSFKGREAGSGFEGQMGTSRDSDVAG